LAAFLLPSDFDDPILRHRKTPDFEPQIDRQLGEEREHQKHWGVVEHVQTFDWDLAQDAQVLTERTRDVAIVIEKMILNSGGRQMAVGFD